MSGKKAVATKKLTLESFFTVERADLAVLAAVA
jgi:hypothetical protein